MVVTLRVTGTVISYFVHTHTHSFGKSSYTGLHCHYSGHFAHDVAIVPDMESTKQKDQDRAPQNSKILVWTVCGFFTGLVLHTAGGDDVTRQKTDTHLRITSDCEAKSSSAGLAHLSEPVTI